MDGRARRKPLSLLLPPLAIRLDLFASYIRLFMKAIHCTYGEGEGGSKAREGRAIYAIAPSCDRFNAGEREQHPKRAKKRKECLVERRMGDAAFRLTYPS